MRVIHVDSARTWRGGQNQVLLTAQGMRALGHEVTVAACRGGVLESRARAAGLDVCPLAFHGDLSPASAAGLVRLIRDFGPDIVHAHDAHALGSALLATRIARRGTLVAARRVDFRLRGCLSRFKYRQARRILAASRAIAGVLERDGFGPECVRVVYEGVADREPPPGGAEALRDLGIPEGAPVVGNVAALTDHKDHATLIEAAARVVARRGDVRFVIAGEGECRPALERRLRETGLADRVLLLGFRDDIDALLPAFALFCLSSHMEGLGTSLLDAMARGLAIVATNAGGIPEAVEHGVSGLIVPARDPARLAGALIELLEDPSRRAAMGAAGRSLFERRFSADRMVENTLRIYGELV